MVISSNIDDVIAFLQQKKEEGYKTVELIDDGRAYGWISLDGPKLEFIFNKKEPHVLGIDARTKK